MRQISSNGFARIDSSSGRKQKSGVFTGITQSEYTTNSPYRQRSKIVGVKFSLYLAGFLSFIFHDILFLRFNMIMLYIFRQSPIMLLIDIRFFALVSAYDD